MTRVHITVLERDAYPELPVLPVLKSILIPIRSDVSQASEILAPRELLSKIRPDHPHQQRVVQILNFMYTNCSDKNTSESSKGVVKEERGIRIRTKGGKWSMKPKTKKDDLVYEIR